MIPVRRNIDPDPDLWGIPNATLATSAAKARDRVVFLADLKGAFDPEVIEAHAIADRMDVELQRRGRV